MIKDDLKSRASDRARSLCRRLERACWAAVSEARARWIGELHDTIAQDMAALSLQLENAHGELSGGDPAAAALRIAHALRLSRHCSKQLRHFMRASPAASVLMDGLGVTLGEWVSRIARGSGLRFFVRIFRADPQIEPAAQGELFRIAQEALANAIRHADADRIRVTWKPRADHWLLRIEDNGVGFVPGKQAANGLGLKILAERARRIGARLDIQSRPGKGTIVSAQYPGFDAHRSDTAD